MTLAHPSTASPTAMVVVRPMSPEDHGFAAALHEKALGHGFFGRLGTGFLGAYYDSYIASPHGVAFIAQTDDGPAGFLVGTFGPHSSWVLRNRWMPLVWRGLVALLARPSELGLFLRTRIGRYARGLLRLGGFTTGRARSGARRGKSPAVLMHVAVSDEARGLGVGGALVDAFLDAARRAGASEACLVTLAGDDGAGAFYRRLGWNLQAVREDRDGRPIECYCRRL